jgi:hypothetical protein
MESTMSLSESRPRRELHHRVIEMRAYAREDGLYDVEARLIDRKPFPFIRDPFSRDSSPVPIPPGQALHDMAVRVTVDDDYVVRHIEASSDVTPWPICKEAEQTLSVLIGERVARGWSAKVKERLRGAASCTHLMELLIPMATTALQGIRGIHPERIHAVNSEGLPLKVDSCYAFGRHRELVKTLWPMHHAPKEGAQSDLS